MDPDATWQMLLDAWLSRDWNEVLEATTALQYWLGRHGFPPETVPGRRMGVDWNRSIVLAACDFAGDLAQRVLDDPHGIPAGVPYSLSCFHCDILGPASFDESVRAGWTQIRFAPEAPGENFLGCCPTHSDRAE